MTEKLKNILAGIEEAQKMIAEAKLAGRNTYPLDRILSELITIKVEIEEALRNKYVLIDLVPELS